MLNMQDYQGEFTPFKGLVRKSVLDKYYEEENARYAAGAAMSPTKIAVAVGAAQRHLQADNRQHFSDPTSVWQTVNDTNVLLDVSGDDVVFAETIEEAYEKFEQLYPAPQYLSTFQLLFSPINKYYAQDNTPNYIQTFADNPVYINNRNNLDRLWDAVKLYGKVHVTNYYPGTRDLEERQCLFVRPNEGTPYVEYAPKKIAARQRQRERREEIRPLTLNDFQSLIKSLFGDIKTVLSSEMGMGQHTIAQKYDEMIPQFQYVISLHSVLFGKSSWKKNKTWHTFIKKWKSKREATIKSLLGKAKPNGEPYRIYTYDEFVSNHDKKRAEADMMLKESFLQRMKEQNERSKKYNEAATKRANQEYAEKEKGLNDLFAWLDKQSKSPILKGKLVARKHERIKGAAGETG